MSLKLGRCFGIDLYIHWSFWLLPLWIVFMHAREPDAGSLAMRLTLLGSLFGCVVLHEYGHALTARLFGIDTRDVTLYPVGGVARLERMSERPLEEFCIAVAGPLVNVVIAAGLGGGILAAGQWSPGLLRGSAGEFLVVLTAMNVALVLFNLLPAFPMDGGRVFRALLTFPFGRPAATRLAVYVSVFFAVLIGASGLLLLHNPWMMFISLFLIWAGQQELNALEARDRQRREEEEADDVAAEAPRPAWQNWNRGGVTVYIWDARKHEWVAQGVIPSHGFSERRPYSPRPW
jgi:Zn-dependent protease